MHRGNYALANGAIPSTSITPSSDLNKDSDRTHIARPDVQSLSESTTSGQGQEPFPFVSFSQYDNTIRPLAHGLKSGNAESISKAAEMMSPMIAQVAAGRQCVLIPVPGHEGTAGYTKDLCEAIGTRLHMETEDVLTGNRHIPLYHAKKNELKPEGIHIIFHLKRPLSENIVPIVVDNVLDTGHTAMAAVKALSFSDAILAVLCNTERYKDNKEANFVQVDNGLSQKTKGKKKSKAKKSVSTAKKKTIKEASRTENKKNVASEKKPIANVIRSRSPQMVTVNGEKVTHAHAFESSTTPGTWYFTARVGGLQLHPKLMRLADVETLRSGVEDIGKLMKTYYPTKLLPKVSKEAFLSSNLLSDGRKIDKFHVFKERDENREDFGKYKMYVEVGSTKMSALMDSASLEAFFDRVVTPAQLVENKLGERLHLASAYQRYELPNPSPLQDIRIFKDTDKIWKVGATIGNGASEKLSLPVAATDLHSYFETHTATKEQLAAKYLMPIFANRMAKDAVNEDSLISIDFSPSSIMKIENQKPDSVHESVSVPQSASVQKWDNFQSFFDDMKVKHPGCLFLFHKGDFYEAYNQDAIAIGNILRLSVVKSKEYTPYIKEMTRFPHHTLDTYLPKFVRAGHRIAIHDFPPSELIQSTKDKITNMNSTEKKPQVRQEEASLTKPKAASKEKTVNDNVESKVTKSTKEQRDKFTTDVVTIAGKNNHNAFVANFGKEVLKSENAKGKEVGLTGLNVLRGRVTFQTTEGEKMQLRDFSSRGLDKIYKDVLELTAIAQIAKNKKAAELAGKVTERNDPKVANQSEQDKFVADIKALMGSVKSAPLPNFGTKEGVVASAGNQGISLSRVYNWNDNISFQGTVPGDDSKQVRYYHPKDIRPEFYDYLTKEVKKSLEPQLVTENGKKVTNASLFQAKDDSSKYLFTARLDGVGLHPKVVEPQDVDKYMKSEISVKDMFAKYYPTKMAKQLGQEQFNDLKLTDGRELTKFRVYKQQKEDKPHFGEYMMYAEMGDRRYHATPMTHDQLDAYFDRTIPKGKLAEKVIGEQLHLASAYQKYSLPPVEGIKIAPPHKTSDGSWVISASIDGKGQTPERKLAGDDLYSLFKSKTATREQLAAKYLNNDIKELLNHPHRIEKKQGLRL